MEDNNQLEEAGTNVSVPPRGFDFADEGETLDKETTAETDEEVAEPSKFVQQSREDRPALSAATGSPELVPLLDLTAEGIFNSDELMVKYFPKAWAILNSGRDISTLSIEDISELSRFSLAKATHVAATYNKIVGPIDNQLFDADGRAFGASAATSKLSEGDELDLDDLGTLECEQSGSGAIIFPLPNSGFRMRLKPIGGKGTDRLEETILHKISTLGRSTVGGGILAMDAILVDAIIDEILKNVAGHNIKGIEQDDWKTLREYISDKDIRLIISMMAHICHLDGYDYGIPMACCKSLQRMNLNIIRTVQYDLGKLNEMQIAQLRLGINAEITKAQVRKYQEAFEGFAESKTFTVGTVKYTVHLRTSTIESRIKAYRLMFNYLEEAAREQLSVSGEVTADAIDDKCQELLIRLWHLHYLPVVAKIDVEVNGKVKTATKPQVILGLLRIISTADNGDMAAALTEFTYDNVVTFATHVPKCDTCGHQVEELRPYDPLTDFFIRRTSKRLTMSIVQEVMMRS